MRHAWTAFAASGDPGWAPHDDGLTRIFDVEPAVIDYPEQVSQDIWADYPDVLDLV
jgi:para-nitrobenzyl esterase